jgi:deoxynucleoside triphosphate triphosphohydrolase SAMHD1
VDAAQVAQRLKESDSFGALITKVDLVIAADIDAYLDTITLAGAVDPPDTKAFKDSMWGMIDLEWQELALLDSPPLQRLRKIKQLGFSSLTYPTAGYSRFEHTLGAVHQTEQMLRTVAARSASEVSPIVNEVRSATRLASLVHDVGHMPFSHVAERYYTIAECPDGELLSEIEAWRAEIGCLLEVPAPRVAECLSVAVVLSPSFERLALWAGYSKMDIAVAALAIVGRSPSLRCAFVSQLVTNVIDADKLDYMFRDAFVTRVPLGVDLERLLYKLKCVSVDTHKLPGRLKNMSVDGTTAWVLGTDVAGLRLVYDLAVARSMLFDRIYLHHKTRAAERVGLKVFERLALHPAELLGHDDALLSRYSRSLKGKARDWARSLELRRLPRRAFAFSYSLLLDNAPLSPTGEPRQSRSELEGWTDLQVELSDFFTRNRLQRAIAIRARRLAKDLSIETSLGDVWLDTLPAHLVSDDPEFVIQRPDNTVDTGSTFPAEAAAFAQSPAAITFIYTSSEAPEVRELVHIATELELAARFGLIFGRSAADYAKISLAALNQRKRDLETATPSLYERDVRLRPTSQTLTRPEIGQRIEALSDKLHQYHSHAEVKITHAHVRGFLDQFPETLVEPALKMLEAIRFVDRDDLGKRFLEWLEGRVPRDAVLVPLTTAFEKSAAHMTYYFPDTAITRPVLPLNQALHTEAPLVLFDDVLLSGTQACDVVRAWFGDQQQLHEDLGGPLTKIERARLVGREVQFRFVYGYAPGIERLRAVVENKQLGGDIAALRYHDEQKPLDDSIERNDELRAYLRKVGVALLKSTKGVEDPERWNTKRCAERALGYGNDEQLVVLPYNTPTGTITALWKSGTFGNAPWLPLVPRRGELGDAE